MTDGHREPCDFELSQLVESRGPELIAALAAILEGAIGRPRGPATDPPPDVEN